MDIAETAILAQSPFRSLARSARKWKPKTHENLDVFVIPPVILCCILSCCLVLIFWHITTAITFHANHHQDHSVGSWPKERNQMFSIPWIYSCISPGYSLSSHQCYFSKPFWQPWLIFGVDLPPLPKKIECIYIYIFIYLFLSKYTHDMSYIRIYLRVGFSIYPPTLLNHKYKIHRRCSEISTRLQHGLWKVSWGSGEGLAWQ